MMLVFEKASQMDNANQRVALHLKIKEVNYHMKRKTRVKLSIFASG